MQENAGDNGGGSAAATSEPVSGAAVDAAEGPSASGSSVPAPGGGPGVQEIGGDGESGPLGQVLEETTNGLSGLLGGGGQGGE